MSPFADAFERYFQEHIGDSGFLVGNKVSSMHLLFALLTIHYIPYTSHYTNVFHLTDTDRSNMHSMANAADVR